VAEFKDFLRRRYLIENADTDAQVIHLYHNLPTIQEVRAKSGISYGRLYRILQRNGIKPYRRQKPARDLVVKFHDEGLPIKQIAALTDYTDRNIRNILREKKAD
jgi:transposase